jgi:hypothetical protein
MLAESLHNNKTKILYPKKYQITLTRISPDISSGNGTISAVNICSALMPLKTVRWAKLELGFLSRVIILYDRTITTEQIL